MGFWGSRKDWVSVEDDNYRITMTRILVQRGSSGGSSSNPSRSSSTPGASSARPEPQVAAPQVLSVVKDEESGEEVQEVVVDELPDYCGSSGDSKVVKSDDLSCHSDQQENSSDETVNAEKVCNDDIECPGELAKSLSDLGISERGTAEDDDAGGYASQNHSGSSQPPPPPVPPPKPSASNSNSRRFTSGSSTRIGPPRRAVAWPIVSTRTSPTGSRPSSPRSHGECEGYNSADEQNPCFVSSYDDIVSFCILSPCSQVLLVFPF